MHDMPRHEDARTDRQSEDFTHDRAEAPPRGNKAVLEETLELVAAGLRDQMRTRPYVTMGLTFGLGYVLGGGIPKFVARAAGAAGLRYAASRLLRSVFSNKP